MKADVSPEAREMYLDGVAEWMKSLADPTRLKILHTLKDGERCVNDILEKLGCSQANVSKHLAVLKHAGLVEARRDGVNIYYRIADPAVFVICETVCNSIERQAEARRLQFERNRDAFRSVVLP
ncbi:MAG: metalloregulator ArsR/SmtB family transcription factor [Thermoanaerobaculia bacterium]|nr:metalloregulator ArsR/SmtB family transcription factor [Thermoanaerobaculia bacterium]